jgi:hypothetical protein
MFEDPNAIINTKLNGSSDHSSQRNDPPIQHHIDEDEDDAE